MGPSGRSGWFGDSKGDGGGKSSHGAMRLWVRRRMRRGSSNWEVEGFLIKVSRPEMCWDVSILWPLRHHFDCLG